MHESMSLIHSTTNNQEVTGHTSTTYEQISFKEVPLRIHTETANLNNGELMNPSLAAGKPP